MINNNIYSLYADYYLQTVLKTVPERYRFNIDWTSLSNDVVYNGGNSNNILDIILKVGLAIKKFPLVNEDGYLTFASKEEASFVLDQDFLFSEFKIENIIENLPRLIKIVGIVGLSNEAAREEITNITFEYYGSAFNDPYPIWEPQPDQYYSDIIATVDGYPDEIVGLYANDDDGILKMYRGYEIPEEITVRVLGYKQNIATSYSMRTTKGKASPLSIENYCINGGITALTSVRDWLYSNYLLYRKCSARLAGDIRLKVAGKFEIDAGMNGEIFEGFITRQKYDFSGSFTSNIEGIGGRKA